MAGPYKNTKNTWNKLRQKQNIELLENILENKNKEFEEIGKITPLWMTRRKFRKEIPEIKKQVEEFLGAEGINTPIKYRNIEFTLNKKINKIICAGGAAIGTTILGITGLIPEAMAGPTYLLGVTLTGINSINIEDVNNEYTHWRHIRGGIINVKHAPKYIVIPTFAHEYTHALQDTDKTVNLFYDTHLEGSVMAEGHARGVQRHISQVYAKKEKNNRFMHQILSHDVAELKSVYTQIRENYHITINEKLLRVNTEDDYMERENKKTEKQPTHHAVGNTLFLLAEAIHGDKIYKEYYHGRFEV